MTVQGFVYGFIAGLIFWPILIALSNYVLSGSFKGNTTIVLKKGEIVE